MTIKAGGKQKQMYLTNHNERKSANKSLKTLIFVVVAILLFATACQSIDYDNNFFQASNETRKNNELIWNWVIKADQYDDLFFIDNELIAVKESDEKYAIVNIKGEMINLDKYSNISNFEEGFALVKRNGKAFFIDKKGEHAFGEAFDDAYSFSNGFAAVKKSGLWGFINNSGNICINL